MVTLARFVWSLKELQVSPLMDVVPDYMPIPDHKATLTDKMGDFLVSPHVLKYSMATDDRTLRHVTQRALIIHMSYLYGASDLMDWLPALLRSAGFNKPARERMVKWGEEDPARVRKVTTAHRSWEFAETFHSTPHTSLSTPFTPAQYCGALLHFWLLRSEMAFAVTRTKSLIPNQTELSFRWTSLRLMMQLIGLRAF